MQPSEFRAEVNKLKEENPDAFEHFESIAGPTPDTDLEGEAADFILGMLRLKIERYNASI